MGVFNQGDQVLVLLPTSTNKLMATWRGPYTVVRCTGKMTYLVDIHNSRKRKCTLHVNMLHQRNAPVVVGYAVAEEFFEDEDISDPLQDFTPDPNTAIPILGEQLNVKQQQELKTLAQFDDVLQSKRGRTLIAVHRIHTGTSRPVRLPPYRLPHAYREAVQKELQQMLDAGVIVPSRSEWAAPIVVVSKKDGGIQLSVD